MSRLIFLFPVLSLLFPLLARAKTLRLAVASTRQPYILPESESGVELDILKAVAQRMGYELKLTLVPAIDLPSVVTNKNIDGINSIYQIKSVPLYYSEPDIAYQNRIISLAKKKIDIKKIEDLSKYSVAAFANAKFSFGEDFKKVAERNKYYTEYKDQSIQPKLLYSGRVDVVISDINIFRYHCRHLKNVQDIPLNYANVLRPTYYSVAFKDPGLRDEFNRALNLLKKDGTYQKILDEHKEIQLAE